MTEQNPFNKKHVEEVTPSQRTLLDELNLPPRLRSFLEENGKYIKAAIFIILILVAAWSFYDYYAAKQKEHANALLFRALNQENPSLRKDLMTELRQDYSSTGAATWGKVISAQREMAANNYREAITQYNALIKEENEDSPLYFLLKYGLASAYESSGKYSEAINHYQILADKPGFTSIATLGLARNNEALGQFEEARKYYENVQAGENISPSVREFIDYKLSTL